MSSFEELTKRGKIALVWAIYRGLPLAAALFVVFCVIHFAIELDWPNFTGIAFQRDYGAYLNLVLATPLVVAVYGFFKGRTPYGEGLGDV